MKRVQTIAIAVGLAAAFTSVLAQTAAPKPATTASGTSAAADLTDGEVRKVDKGTKKITIKHGEIKSMDMPPMTMVFQVQEPALLDAVKAGDKVRFKVINSNGAMVVTEIQPAK